MGRTLDDVLNEKQISITEIARRGDAPTTVVWKFFKGYDVYASTVRKICEGMDIGFFQLMACWEETRRENGLPPQKPTVSRGIKKGDTYFRPRKSKVAVK
jgi:hypothetical protein